MIPPENLGRIRKDKRRRPPLSSHGHSLDSSFRDLSLNRPRSHPARPLSSRSTANGQGGLEGYSERSSLPGNVTLSNLATDFLADYCCRTRARRPASVLRRREPVDKRGVAVGAGQRVWFSNPRQNPVLQVTQMVLPVTYTVCHAQ